MSKVSRTAPLLLGLVLVLSGCSDDQGKKPVLLPEAGSTAPLTVPAAPRVGACYLLDVRAALRTTSTKPPVSCNARHTAVTVAVGTARPVVDGHLLALDSAQVQRQVADRCRRSVDAHVGGSIGRQRLSRVQAVWFTPTHDQADRGALWYRCDLVISAGGQSLAKLPRKTRGLLAAPGAMNRWGTCGTAAPSSKSFRRVLCSAPHRWRARSTVDLPRGTAYLAKAAGRRADARCREVAAALSPSRTRFRWAFEWPTRAQWRSGQRYGFCWTPR